MENSILEELNNYDVFKIYNNIIDKFINYNFSRIDENININNYIDIINYYISNFKIINFDIVYSNEITCVSENLDVLKSVIVTIIYIDIYGNIYYNSQLLNVQINNEYICNMINWNKELFIKPFSQKNTIPIYNLDFISNKDNLYHDLINYYYNSIDEDIIELTPHTYSQDILINESNYNSNNKLLYNLLLEQYNKIIKYI
jgi:hypothetical protein